MKRTPIFIVVIIGILQASAVDARTDKLCKPLRAFAASIKPDEKRSLEFHTSWGGNFKDDPEPAIFAKRCTHYDYNPAKAVCTYLMEHGAIEFSNRNLQRALTCLSPKTRFDPDLSLNKADVSFSYGTEQRGSIINVSFDRDSSTGGMVLKIDADGY